MLIKLLMKRDNITSHPF